MGKFINPFTDFGFKHIFGREMDKDILIEFLNDLLEGEHTIKDLRIMNNERLPETEQGRKVIFDIHCETDKGERIIIEMQNREQPHFKDRALYYLSHSVVEQGIKGTWDYELAAVYGVFFLNFTLDENGITLHNVSSFGGASVKRIHRPVNEEGKVVSVGAYMIPLLQENCEKRGIDIVLNTTVDTILTDANGAAVGVSGTDKDGNTVVVNAKSVILATGGFGANLDMVTKYKPELAGFMTTNAAGAQGQGIEMATAIGAGTVDMDQIQIHPTVEANTAALITEGLRGDGAILVNANGERFIDEVGTRDVVSAAEIAQPGSYSWLIVDQAMVDASSVIQGYIKKGYTKTGATYEELAKELDIDPATFANTMETWNGYVEAKNDPDFGRTSFANPLNNGPYYAIKVTAGVHHTMGGVTINSATEVLKEDGTVIPGLFAAGEVTGGVHGANRLGGTAVADFVVFGRIAGESAANYASAQ